jgi:hypothetical protein
MQIFGKLTEAEAEQVMLAVALGLEPGLEKLVYLQWQAAERRIKDMRAAHLYLSTGSLRSSALECCHDA